MDEVENIDLSPEQMEKIYEVLESMGIEVIGNIEEEVHEEEEEIDLDEDKMTISAGFTQEETLKFSMPLVKAQLKILLVDGTVCASPIFDVSVDDILNPKLMENTEVGD